MSDQNPHESASHSKGDAAAPIGNELSGTVQGPSIQAGTIHGGVQVNMAARPPIPRPEQLPSPGFFVNRHRELSDLRRLAERTAADGGPAVIVISGTGGVGKTTLSLRWLNQLRDDYTDGQLFVDLQGLSGNGNPMSSSGPLERFLRALGVEAERIPLDPGEQAALFRSMTARRRLIVLLDNAVSAAQIRPMIPGPGPALVVVTTRRQLSGLARSGASFFELAPLDEPGAVELLDRMVGSGRIQAELREAQSLVKLCGGLPLAVCATGARLLSRRRLTIAHVVRELVDETRRLAALSTDEETSVKAVFDLSYQGLPDDAARRLYRLLSVHPGADFDQSAAAAIAELDADEAAGLLDGLLTANLLEEVGADRFRFHDLIRLHAREKLASEQSAQEHQAAFDRLAHYYLEVAVAADLTLLPGRWHLGACYEADRAASFPDRDAALAWLELERGNLMAVVHETHRQGRHEVTWQICEAMWSLFLLHKHYHLWIEAHEIGLAAARACADPRAEGRMLQVLGVAYLHRHDFETAAGHFHQALRRTREADHPIGESSALEGLATAALATGRHDHAIDLYSQARRILQQLDRPRGVALMTRYLGQALARAGRHDEAIDHFTDALRYFTQVDEPYHQARTLSRLADVCLLAGRFDEAGEALRRSLAISIATGARHEQANVHAALAQLAAAQGDPADEQDHLRQALGIYSELGAPEAQDIERRLARQGESGG